MPNWFLKCLSGIIYLLYLVLFGSYLTILIPGYYVWHLFTGNLAPELMTDGDFTKIPDQVASPHAIATFPSLAYTGLMLVGTTLMVISILTGLRALLQLLQNVADRRYLSHTNTRAFKQLMQAQAALLVGSGFMATANQLTTSWLFLTAHSTFSATWGDLPANLCILFLLTVLYFGYQGILTEHQANRP